MKRVFIDTNVLIDYLGHRESFYVEAAVSLLCLLQQMLLLQETRLTLKNL